MKILSRDFGEVEIRPEDVIQFRSPIYGFEELSRYVLLFEEENRHIVWLQSLEDPDICFVMVDPSAVDPSYHPHLSIEAQRLLGEGNWLYWLVVVVAEDFRKSTVNLKSPVVINIDRGCAVQTILEEDYPIRQPLFREEKEGQQC